MTEDEWKLQRLNAMIDDLEALAYRQRQTYVHMRQTLGLAILVSAMAGMVLGICITRLVHG